MLSYAQAHVKLCPDTYQAMPGYTPGYAWIYVKHSLDRISQCRLFKLWLSWLNIIPQATGNKNQSISKIWIWSTKTTSEKCFCLNRLYITLSGFLIDLDIPIPRVYTRGYHISCLRHYLRAKTIWKQSGQNVIAARFHCVIRDKWSTFFLDQGNTFV